MKLNNMSRAAIVAGVVMSLLMFLTIFGFSLIDVNEVGYAKFAQHPNGQVVVHSEPGYFWAGLAKVTAWRTANDTIAFSQSGKTAIPVRFRDGGQAHVTMDVTFKLAVDEDALTKIFKDWHTYDQLLTGLIRPQVNNVVQLTATKLSAEDSYTKKDAFIYQIHDQLVNGIYQYDQVVEKGQVRFVLSTSANDKGGTSIERQTNPFKEYNITITKVTVRDVVYAPEIEQTLKAKQEAIQAQVTSKAKAERAKQEAVEAEALGQKSLAEQVASEKAKTAAMEESLHRQKLEAQAALTRAKLDAQATRLKADAEAYRRRKLAAANDSLDARLEAFVKANEAWASSTNTPPVVFNGGATSGKNGTDPLYSMMMMRMMSDQMGVKAPKLSAK